MPIEFKQLQKSFGDKHILRGVDIAVRDGECFFVIGSSGAGKSVLIKHLVGLLRPDAGDIFLDGEEVSRLSEKDFYRVRMKCAMVFQHSTLFDSMTCAQNVALPLRMHKGLDMDGALKEAHRRLDQVHMAEFASAFPAELGDGMRKRVAIARALTLDPRYVLFDEPTTSLDPISARRVDKLIHELSRDYGVTSIVVSHDLTSIFTIASRIAMLYQGHVLKLGTPEEFRSAHDPIVRQFVTGQAEGPMQV
jgi:phospholipid/cholesterol/gamma-HCH transport system ATP-binding protein